MSTVLSAQAKCAVVIPYFQRQRGLLEACVRSVLEQQVNLQLQLLVVDDSSPLPAAEELRGIADARLRILVQPNAGPGAARNRGIEAVDADTEYIAFLDSDDVWTPGHLQRLLLAFEAGCDMAFANSSRYGKQGGRFDWGGGSAATLGSGLHRQLGEQVQAYEGDFFDLAVRRSGLISTSTLAYRYAAMPSLRFSPQLFNGQDRFFKLQCSKLARSVGFCTAIGAVEGQGENIFDSSAWGSEKGLRLLRNYIRLHKLTLAVLPLSEPQREHVRTELRDTRRAVLSTCLHLLRQRKRVDWAMVGGILREDPRTLMEFPGSLLRALRARGKAKSKLAKGSE